MKRKYPQDPIRRVLENKTTSNSSAHAQPNQDTAEEHNRASGHELCPALSERSSHGSAPSIVVGEPVLLSISSEMENFTTIFIAGQGHLHHPH